MLVWCGVVQASWTSASSANRTATSRRPRSPALPLLYFSLLFAVSFVHCVVLLQELLDKKDAARLQSVTIIDQRLLVTDTIVSVCLSLFLCYWLLILCLLLL